MYNGGRDGAMPSEGVMLITRFGRKPTALEGEGEARRVPCMTAPSPGPDGNRIVVNPLNGEQTLLSTLSSARHLDHGAVGECNFCPGNEETTGIEIDRVESRDGWRARTWLNRWPVVTAGEGELRGQHEVGVYSQEHDRTLGGLLPEDIEAVQALLTSRLAAHHTDGWAATLLLVNHGVTSGRSVIHPHFQLYALADLPPTIAAEGTNLQGENCVLCALDLAALSGHVVVADEETVTLCPPWSTKPGELLIFGRKHTTTMPELVPALSRAAAAVEDEEGISYNVGGHAAPHGTDFHDHIHLMPRPERACGFGAYTGLTVVKSEPTESAAALRAQLPSSHQDRARDWERRPGSGPTGVYGHSGPRPLQPRQAGRKALDLEVRAHRCAGPSSPSPRS